MSPVTRSVPVAALAGAIPAELPATAVEPSGDVPKAQTDLPRQPSDPDTIDRRLEIDPATRQVIYQAIDKASGEVVRQIPEETMLRLQVYARAMRLTDAARVAEVERIA